MYTQKVGLPLVATPPKISHTGRHCVGWHAVVCYGAPVPAHPSTNPVEQPIDLFFNRPAYTTFLRVGIKAWSIAPLAGSLSNRPQGEITPAALRSSRISVG
jgi:hypothetical protein